MRQALSDISVVEVGSGVAATWCGKVFADLGADVVKIEPPGGDRLRADRGAFAHLNTNKRSATLERSGATAGGLLQLIDGADLVIEAPAYGALGDWGVDRDELMASRPLLSVVAISGFGVTGPYAGFAWSDLVAQAFAGSLVPDRRGPIRLPMAVAECTVGHTAAVGALAAVCGLAPPGQERSSTALPPKHWPPTPPGCPAIWDGSTATGRISSSR